MWIKILFNKIWHERFSPLEEEGRMWSNLPDVSGFCTKHGQMWNADEKLIKEYIWNTEERDTTWNKVWDLFETSRFRSSALLQYSTVQYKCSLAYYEVILYAIGPPLWSSGQSFWQQIQRSRVRSPALPDFLSSSGSGTGSNQPREPREVNWGATWMKKVAAPGLENRD